jgi:hypothetical protein
MNNTPKPNNKRNLILGVLILIAVGFGVYYLGAHIIGVFNGFSDDLKTGVITAFAVIAVALIGFFTNKSIEHKRSIEKAMRPKKLELYDEYIKFLFRVFNGKKVDNEPTKEEMTKFFVEKNPFIVTYASNGVIEKMGKMRPKLSNTETAMFTIEDLLLEMRKDLGHTKRGFKQGDILRLFINDVDDYLENGKKSAK